MNIARVIKGWRLYYGYSTRQAARTIGIDRQALMKLEAGRSVSHGNLAIVIRWLLE